jgi:hypothetical protein
MLGQAFGNLDQKCGTEAIDAVPSDQPKRSGKIDHIVRAGISGSTDEREYIDQTSSTTAVALPGENRHRSA